MMNNENKVIIKLARVINTTCIAFPPISIINKIRLIMKATNEVRIDIMKNKFIFEIFFVGLTLFSVILRFTFQYEL